MNKLFSDAIEKETLILLGTIDNFKRTKCGSEKITRSKKTIGYTFHQNNDMLKLDNGKP